MVKVLSVKDLVVGYKDTPVAGPLNIEVGRGELILLSGRNGSGKTSLLKTIAGLLKPLSGRVEGQKTVYVPTRIPKVKGFTVEDFIGLNVKGDFSGTMEALGIRDLAGRDLSTLSDGQFQKVCLAPAIASGKSLLLLDEPTAFLDHGSRLSLMRLLREITKPGTDSVPGMSTVSVLLSSHDLELCTPFCDRVINLD